MAIKGVKLRLVADDEQLKKTLDEDKASALKLSDSLKGLKIKGDDADLKYKLRSLDLSADRLREKLDSPRLSIRGYERANLQLLKLNAEADKLNRKISVDVTENKRGGILKALVSGSGSASLLKSLLGGSGGGAESGAGAGAAAGGSGLLDLLTSPVALGAAAALAPAAAGGALGLGIPAIGYLLGNKGLATMQADRQALAQAQTSVQGSKNPSLSQLRALHVAQQQLNKDTHGWAGEMAKVGQQFQPVVRQVMGFVRSLAGPLSKLFSASIPGIRAFITALEPAIKTVLPLLTKSLRDNAPAMKVLGQAFGDLLVIGVKLFTGLARGFRASAIVVKATVDAIGGILDFLGSIIGNVVRLIGDVFVGHWRDAWNTAKAIAQSFVNFAYNTFGALEGKMVSIGEHILSGLLSGLKAAAGSVLSFIGGLAGNIASSFAGILGIHSPSKVFESYGMAIVDGLSLGISKRQKKINAQMKQFAQGVKGSYISGFDITSVTNAAGGNPSAGDVMHFLGTSLSQLKTFAANVKKLAREGLNHKLLRQIIAAGPIQGGAVAQALADASLGSIRNINREEQEISSAASGIGRSVGRSLYMSHPGHHHHHHGHTKHEIDLKISAQGNDPLVKAIVHALRRDIKVNGGGNVQKYLGWGNG